jgi:hypothetical protein
MTHLLLPTASLLRETQTTCINIFMADMNKFQLVHSIVLNRQKSIETWTGLSCWPWMYNEQFLQLCETWGYQSSDYDDYCLLECDSM